MPILGRRPSAKVLIVAFIFIAVAYYPTLRWLASAWLGNAHYRIGLLVPFASALLAWRLQRGHAMEGLASGWLFYSGLLGVVVGLLLHALALRDQAFLLSSLTLPFVLAGATLALAGPLTLRRQAFPLCSLFLALPWPWLQTCSPALTQGVAEVAAALGRLLGIPVTVSGADLHLPVVALDVASPCTGTGSLLGFVVIAVFYAFLVRGPLPGKLALVLLAAPTALLASTARVVALLGLSHYVGVEFALRSYRLWSVALLFLVGYLFFVLIARVLRCDEVRSDL